METLIWMVVVFVILFFGSLAIAAVMAGTGQQYEQDEYERRNGSEK